jgi:two-component system sensor histidine kinase/response regulator
MQEQGRILIVDDNPHNVAILEELLDDDYQLRTAASGEEALAMAPEFSPAVILLDIMMPGIDGYETCRRIRTTPGLRHTKIILVSARAMVSERLRGYEAGADDYIIKPFDKHELRAKVCVYLRLKSVEEVEQLKSNLLGLLSHETNTPLNGILPAVELLLADEDMDVVERRMWLSTIHQSATHLHRLFTKVMTLSMMKSGKWRFQLAPVDLTEVIRRAVCDVATPAAMRHVQIESELPETASTMLDWEQMHGVIRAILENAIRFSPAEERITIGVWRDDKVFRLTVTDRGAGIASDFLPRVFEEFAEADVSHHTEGHGLSLAIARLVVLAHHGTIGVESTQGRGTTFTVRLPVAE